MSGPAERLEIPEATRTAQARDLCVSLGVAMTLEDSWGGDIVTAAIAHLAHSTPTEFHFTSTDFNSYVTVDFADGAPRRVQGRMRASTAGSRATELRESGQVGGGVAAIASDPAAQPSRAMSIVRRGRFVPDIGNLRRRRIQQAVGQRCQFNVR